MNLPSQNQTISSREIAELTGKTHSAILKAIRKMEESWKQVTGVNFALSEYTDSSGKTNPEYLLTKTESLFVASKFNDVSRAKVVIRWEKLETEKQQFKPLSQLEILAQSTQILIEQDQRIGNLENKVEEIVAQTKTRPDYFSIVGYASLHKIPCPLPVAAKLGRAASRICKQNDIPMDILPDPRFGTVKLYPIYVLQNVFNRTPLN